MDFQRGLLGVVCLFVASMHKKCLVKTMFDLITSQARSYNRQMRPAILDHSSGAKWTNTSNHPEFLVGEEVRFISYLK